ncbi:type II secretion system F family protein, partial [Streptococcus pneumoniae]|nr:type II secretion system F family protein [Streptococcus pneumoniae]
RVQRGESLRDSLRGSSGLPASFSGLVLAGEQSGRLEESFGHLARLFELELVSALETFLAALEPLSIALVGSVVLGVLLVVFV